MCLPVSLLSLPCLAVAGQPAVPGGGAALLFTQAELQKAASSRQTIGRDVASAVLQQLLSLHPVVSGWRDAVLLSLHPVVCDSCGCCAMTGVAGSSDLGLISGKRDAVLLSLHPTCACIPDIGRACRAMKNTDTH